MKHIYLEILYSQNTFLNNSARTSGRQSTSSGHFKHITLKIGFRSHTDVPTVSCWFAARASIVRASTAKMSSHQLLNEVSSRQNVLAWDYLISNSFSFRFFVAVIAVFKIPVFKLFVVHLCIDMTKISTCKTFIVFFFLIKQVYFLWVSTFGISKCNDSQYCRTMSNNYTFVFCLTLHFYKPLNVV